MSDRAGREFDAVVYGATGFTGRLACAYLEATHGRNVRWALAGRDLERLRGVREALGLPASTTLLRADDAEPETLRAMAAQARVVISTVGPYQLHGSGVVAACAQGGADYVDMSGEPVWMRDMLDRHAAAARRSGARMLFSCGFDSVPFDLGVHRLQALCREQWGRPSARVRCRVRGLQGGVSGGTAETKRATEAAIARRPQIGAMLSDPFLLTPGWRGAAQPAADAVTFEEATGCWVAPFYMAFINTKHVHRTNHLLGEAYGSDFRYDEMIAVAGGGAEGRAAARARADADPFIHAGALRSGEGPSAAERRTNFFDLLFIAEHPDGRRLALACGAPLDPGYEGSARMLVETALALGSQPGEGGFWTPAALMADRLADRLAAHAAIRFEPADPTPLFATAQDM